MKSQIQMWFVIACAALATIACEVILSATPTPIIVVVTATPAPSPVVLVVTATPAPTIALPTSQPVAIAPSPIPVSASPTPFLPQLGVFDQTGNGAEALLFGASVAKTHLVFRALACVPNCKASPDGRDVDEVKFMIFAKTAQGTLQHLFESTTRTAPYCAFGGSGRCDWLNLADPNARFPNTQVPIANGSYVIHVSVAGKRDASCFIAANFSVQR